MSPRFRAGDLWINLNDRTGRALREGSRGAASPAEALRVRYTYANELLFAGRYEDAIAQTDILLEQIDEVGPEVGAGRDSSTC